MQTVTVKVQHYCCTVYRNQSPKRGRNSPNRPPVEQNATQLTLAMLLPSKRPRSPIPKIRLRSVHGYYTKTDRRQTAGSDGLQTYDIVAAVPCCQRSFELLCRHSDVDIISMPLRKRLPFTLVKKMVRLLPLLFLGERVEISDLFLSFLFSFARGEVFTCQVTICSV